MAFALFWFKPLNYVNFLSDETTEKLFGLNGFDLTGLLTFFLAVVDGFQLALVAVKIVSF